MRYPTTAITLQTPPISLPPRYRLSGHVANGGMASVWAAEDRVLGRLVAFKLLAPQFAQDSAALRRFEREARAAAALSGHPNVVTIYDVGEHDGRPYMVMEYLTGGSVADLLRAGRIERAEALAWLREAAAALDAAHQRGIIHRDVKPANLLLDERRRLAITDFGIARLAYDDGATTSSGQLTSTGQVLGTAAYVAPEQAAGEPVTAASDRYALAVVAFELLTGGRPFEGGGFAAQARAHIDEDPPRPSERAPDLPPAVDPVLLRGLAKDPRRRWGTAAEMVDALELALDGEASRTEPTATEPTMVAPPGPAPVPLPPPPRGHARRIPRPPSRPRGRRLPVALALLGVAAVAAALIASALSGGGGDGTPAARSKLRPPAAPRSRPPGARRAPATSRSQPSGFAGAAALNDRGFALSNAGRYQDAIPLLQRAAQDCPVAVTQPCAYAWFNLGHALRLAGRPGEAVPVLERRLQNPDQRGAVAAELAAARSEATGGAPSQTGGTPAHVPPGQTRKGHGKHGKKGAGGDEGD